MSNAIVDALERIADALERQADNDPLAVLNAAMADAPDRIDLTAETHSLGGGRWVATVPLAPAVPGWAINLSPDPVAAGGVRVVLVGPTGDRHPLAATGDA